MVAGSVVHLAHQQLLARKCIQAVENQLLLRRLPVGGLDILPSLKEGDSYGARSSRAPE